MALHFVLNGEPTEVDEVDPNVTLLQWLRGARLSGTKEGCAEGECGACAVAMLGRDAGGRACYRAINSCLLPLASVDGHSVVTVEGVAEGDELHPVQSALIEHAASQCGYCTPGFVMSMYCEYYRPGRGASEPEAISGNLCRCTGYRPILDALHSLPAPAAHDRRLPQLALRSAWSSAPDRDGARFLRPRTLAQLFDLQRRHPEATLLAGGTDLMVGVTQRHERFRTVIALDAVAELRRFERSPSELVLGAGNTLSELEQQLAAHPTAAPMLAQLWPLFSSRLIRNRATLGGNLATASPIGDAAPCLLSLAAELTLVSPRGERRLACSELFTGYRTTALAADELILSVHIALPTPPLQRFYKVSKRTLDDISTVSAAFALELDGETNVRCLRAAYGGVAATPLRARAVEDLALGRPFSEATVRLLVAELEQLGTPLSDARGSAAYRRAMMARLLEKFWFETARGETP
jgi:xanthine dehydrogenase small subunit